MTESASGIQKIIKIKGAQLETVIITSFNYLEQRLVSDDDSKPGFSQGLYKLLQL